MRLTSRTFLIALLCLASFPAAAADALTAEQKEAVKATIGEYLKEKPEVVIEALEAYRAKQEQEMQQKAEANIKTNMDFLAGADAPSTGNPKGDVTVIEFFDYNCGYCKKALPDIQQLLKDDKNLRVVFHEMPILAESSRTAALWAIAAHKQGKYFEYHVALMDTAGQKDVQALEKIAQDIGLDVKKMHEDANAPETAQLVDKSMSVARDIGVQGTPAFIVNGTLYPGYLGPDGLKESIEKARGKSDNKDG